MSQRIRYINLRSDSNNILVSQRVFSYNGIDYRVYLHPMDGLFEVKNEATGELLISGTGSSESSIKIKAKKALASIGILFENETRTVA